MSMNRKLDRTIAGLAILLAIACAFSAGVAYLTDQGVLK